MKKIPYLLPFILLTAFPAAWGIPSQITYQGKLMQNGIPVTNTTKHMTFQLTNGGPAAGLPTTQTYSDPIDISTVPVTNGLFSVQLNFTLKQGYTWESITPYLNVTVENQLLNPPEPVAATVYSLVSNTVVNGAIDQSKIAAGYGLVPTGSVVAFAGSNPPAGWLLCDGSPVSRTTYSSLFSSIGVTWGTGDGSSTFNLPNLLGRTPVGAGQGVGLSIRTLGQTLGEETHVLTIQEMPNHTHQYGKSSPDINVDNTGSTRVGLFTSDSSGQPTTSIGGGGAHNNMQPSTVVNFIIKY